MIPIEFVCAAKNPPASLRVVRKAGVSAKMDEQRKARARISCMEPLRTTGRTFFFHPSVETESGEI